jgi:hypothetical protein
VCEWEVGELIVHLVLVVSLVLQHSLELQGFIRLNEVQLLLPFVVTNLLLIYDHLLSEVVEEFVVLHPLFYLKPIMLFFVCVDLIDDCLQELFLVAGSGVELDSLCESLASASLNERTQEWEWHTLFLGSAFLFNCLSFLLLSLC